MPHRLVDFLLVIGVTLPIVTLPTVRAGSVVTAGDLAGSAEGGTAGAIRWPDVMWLLDSGTGWPLDRDPSEGVRFSLLSADAWASLEPAARNNRSWLGVEISGASLPASVLLSEFALTAAPSRTRLGEPIDGETARPAAPGGGNDFPLNCNLPHDRLGIISGSDAISAWRLIFFLLLGSAAAAAAGAGTMRRRPMTPTESVRSDSGLDVGDEAVLESPGSPGIWVALDGETLGAILDAQERSDLEDVAFLLARGRMMRVRNGTRVEVLKLSDDSAGVCIRNGPQRGVEVWLQRHFVRRVRVLPRYNFSGTLRERAGHEVDRG